MQVTVAAAENRHAAILELAVSQGVTLSDETLFASIASHSLECVKAAVESNPGNLPDCALVFAAAHGFSDGVRYLHRRGFALWDEETPIDAEGLLWLHEALKFHMYYDFSDCPYPNMPQDPWILGDAWGNLDWGCAREDILNTPSLEPGHAAPMPQIDSAQGATHYDEDGDRISPADLVRVLGNSGVGGEALMDAWLVPERTGKPPLLCSWQTVSAAARAGATRTWDWRPREKVVHAHLNTIASVSCMC